MTCGIYKITNNITKKSYIGQSIHIEQRWKEHIRDAHIDSTQCKLYPDLVKYGEKNFTFSILEKCPKDWLDAREAYWIKHYQTIQYGYNTTLVHDNSTKRSKQEPQFMLMTEEDIKTLGRIYNRGYSREQAYDVFKNQVSIGKFNVLWDYKVWKNIDTIRDQLID